MWTQYLPATQVIYLQDLFESRGLLLTLFDGLSSFGSCLTSLSMFSLRYISEQPLVFVMPRVFYMEIPY